MLFAVLLLHGLQSLLYWYRLTFTVVSNCWYKSGVDIARSLHIYCAMYSTCTYLGMMLDYTQLQVVWFGSDV